MALSGRFYSNDTTTYPYLRVDWSATQDYTNRTSTVTAYAYLIYTSLNIDSGNTCSFSFGGDTQSLPFDGVNDSSTNEKMRFLGSFTKTVQHNENSGYNGVMEITARVRNAGFLAAANALIELDVIYRATTIDSATDINADDETPVMSLSVTAAANGFVHRLELLDGQSSVITHSNITYINSGNQGIGYMLTTDERTTLLSHMANMKSFNGTLRLTTYVNGENIGSNSISVNVNTRESVSAPTMSGFTIADINTNTVNITGNNQVLIQGYSRLRITCGTVTTKNGATFKSVSATCGNKSWSTLNQNSYIDLNEINTSGELEITVTATDSRGYTTVITQKVTVTPYTKPKFSSISLKRQDGVGSTMQLSFSGQIYDILVSSVNKNSILSISYRTKKTNESSYGSWVSLRAACSINGNNFSYSSLQAFTLAAANSFDVEFMIQDSLILYYYDIVVPQGTPLIDIGKGIIKFAADIYMNGMPVLGKRTLSAFDFHTLTEQGIYYFNRSASSAAYSDPHAPSEPADGNVIVINPSGTFVIHLYFGMGCYWKRGTYSGSSWSWSSWKTLSGT